MNPRAQPADLSEHLKGLKTDPSSGLVAKDRYISREFWELENEKLWSKVWQCACLAIDVAEPGDYYEYQVGDQSILIVRTDEGVLKAFENTCLHRGNRIRHGCGHVNQLRCPYHLWTWNLDGTLKNVPSRKEFPQVKDSEYCLHEYQVDTWGGLVFVTLDPNAESLQKYIEPIPKYLDPYHLEEMTCINRATVPVDANWKTVCDAFLEDYHVQGIHPQLLPTLDIEGTTYDLWGRHSRMIMPMGQPSSSAVPMTQEEQLLNTIEKEKRGYIAGLLDRGIGFDAARAAVKAGRPFREVVIESAQKNAKNIGFDTKRLDPEQLLDDHHLLIFPNLVYNVYGFFYTLMRYRPAPGDPEKAFFDVYNFRWFPESKRGSKPKAEHRFHDDPMGKLGYIADQDFENLPTVQKGMHGQAFKHLTLSRYEQRIMAMHEAVDGYIFDS